MDVTNLYLHTCIDKILNEYTIECKDKGIIIEMDYSNIDNDCNIIADENLLNVVIKNMIDNALLFTTKGIHTIYLYTTYLYL